MLISLVVTFLCTFVYAFAKRPKMLMRIHFPLQILSYRLIVNQTNLIGFLFAFILYILPPAYFVCLAYQLIFMRKFHKPQESQGGDEP